MDGVVDVEQLVADFDSGAERDFRTAFYIGRVVLDAESNRQSLSVFDDIATEFDGGGVGERRIEQLHCDGGALRQFDVAVELDFAADRVVGAAADGRAGQRRQQGDPDHLNEKPGHGASAVRVRRYVH